MSLLDDETLLKQSPLFDAEWYQARYNDVRDADISPERHFLKYGWRLGRSPGPGFSTTAYLERYGDVRRTGVNPLVHYLRNGQREGREITPVADGLLSATHIKGLTVSPKSTVTSESSKPRASNGIGKERLARQLEDTQQRLEHYFKRCQALEIQLHDQ